MSDYSQGRLLVAHHEPSSCRALCEILRKAGHEVIVAEDGLSALDLARFKPAISALNDSPMANPAASEPGAATFEPDANRLSELSVSRLALDRFLCAAIEAMFVLIRKAML